MNDQDHDSPRNRPADRHGAAGKPKRRKRRLWRWVALALVLLAVVAGFGYRWLTDPTRLRHFAQAYLEDIFRTDVSIASVEFSMDEGIRIRDVTVDDPESGDPLPPMIRCREVMLRHDAAALFRGRLRIVDVAARGVTCRAVFDEETGTFNLQEALAPARTPRRRGKLTLPRIELRDARVIVQRRGRQADEQVETVRLHGSGRPVGTAPEAYEVQWTATTDRESSGSARIQFAPFRVSAIEGGTPWLSIDAAMMAVNATNPEAGPWLSLFDVDGRFRAVDYSFGADPDFPPAGGSRLTLECEARSWEFPFTDENRARFAAPPYLRLENISGRVTVDADHAAADLTGKFHGSPCGVQARLCGPIEADTSLADLCYELRIDLTDFTLPSNDPVAAPAEARFLQRWVKTRNFYRDFDPHGKVDVRIELAKDSGEGESLGVRRLVATARGADASYRGFPYRVTGLEGSVEFTPDGVRILGLTGRHDDGTVTVHGWLSATRHDCAAELFISGDDIALDDALCSAITGRYRSVWRNFSPEGYADIHVYMARPEGVNRVAAPWNTCIDSQLINAEAMFEGFPYPLKQLNGRVIIDSNVFKVSNVEGMAGAGQVDVNGTARMTATGLSRLDLRIKARNIAINQQLLAALEPLPRRRIEAFAPDGRINLAAQLSYDPLREKILYDISTELAGVSVRHAALPIRVDDVSGRLRLQPDAVEIASVEGRLGQGHVEASGRVEQSQGEVRPNLRLSGKRIVFDAELRQALPVKVRAALADWSISGMFDVESRVRTSAAPGKAAAAESFVTILSVAGLTVSHQDFPWPLRLTSGQVRVEDERVTFSGVTAIHADSRMTVNGSIDASREGLTVDLGFEAPSLPFSESLRQAVPWRVRRSWNDVKPDGAIGVRDGRLTYSRRPDDSVPRWALQGTVEFQDAAFDLGAPFREIRGRASIRGAGRGPFRAISLSGRLELDALKLRNWHITDLRGGFSRAGPEAIWHFENLGGALWGGGVTAELTVDAGAGESRYDLSATVQRVGLGEFARSPAAADDERNPVAGELDGRIYLSGVAGDPQDRRGGGRFAIHGAKISRLPLVFDVLQVLNLSKPEESAFQEAQADFYVKGNEVRLDDLLLRGNSLAMIGSGTLDLPTRELDLQMTMVNPNRGARVPIVSELIEGASRELVEVIVRGTLEEPRITTRPLRGLEDALDTLVVPRKDRKQPRKR